MAQTRARKSAASAATGLLTVAAAALALAGCGGSSPQQASVASSSGSAAAPAASAQASAGQSSSSVITGTSGSKSKSSGTSGSAAAGSGAGKGSSQAKTGAKTQLRAVDVVSKPSSHKARGGPDEPEMPAITAPNPCRLVSRTEASTILGATVVQTEAPLGPTCIMKVGQQKQVVTLAVEAVSVKTQLKNMHEVETATVGGHQTYCGKLGSPQLYLRLSGGKAIAVSAPCAAARALAATALSHLKA